MLIREKATLPAKTAARVQQFAQLLGRGDTAQLRYDADSPQVLVTRDVGEEHGIPPNDPRRMLELSELWDALEVIKFSPMRADLYGSTMLESVQAACGVMQVNKYRTTVVAVRDEQALQGMGLPYSLTDTGAHILGVPVVFQDMPPTSLVVYGTANGELILGDTRALLLADPNAELVPESGEVHEVPSA